MAKILPTRPLCEVRALNVGHSSGSPITILSSNWVVHVRVNHPHTVFDETLELCCFQEVVGGMA